MANNTKDSNKNKAIHCCVESCTHHCKGDNYCSLDCIYVGTHEHNPKMNQCTDCQSFENKDLREQKRAIDRDRQQYPEKYEQLKDVTF